MVDLTLQDSTQQQLFPHLQRTEWLLAQAAAEASGKDADAEIILLPDLGLPHNVTRILGGFFTGAYYRWDCAIPFVPIDATVNVDTVSVFHIAPSFEDACGFYDAVSRASKVLKERSSYTWNFDIGNHFITWARLRNSDIYENGDYLVLHASASEFKWQHNGLYPAPDNWYSNSVKRIVEPRTNRFMRYICGSVAERFIDMANGLVAYNRIRHEYISGLICGTNGVLKEVLSVPHYGMPANNSVAIGCQWLMPDQHFLLLTAPTKPMFIVRACEGQRNKVVLPTHDTLLHPHGLGQRSKTPLSLNYLCDSIEINGSTYRTGEEMDDNPTLELRDFGGFSNDHKSGQIIYPNVVKRMLELCPGEVIGELQPIQSYCRGLTNCR